MTATAAPVRLAETSGLRLSLWTRLRGAALPLPSRQSQAVRTNAIVPPSQTRSEPWLTPWTP